MKSVQRQAGLTLIELMVAVLIVSILMAVGANSYSRWTQNQQVRVAAESILNAMQLARAEAVKRNGSVRLVMGDLSSWSIIEATGGAILQTRTSAEGSNNATVTATPGGATTVTFSSLGRVTTNSDGSAALSQVDIDNPSGDRPLRITVSAGGNARMCDPSPKLAAGDPRAC